MPFLVICQDSADATELRETHLKAHQKYIQTVAPMVCVAGSMSQTADAIANDLCEATCFIFDTEELGVAHKLLRHDPYAQAGVYSQVAFAKFNPAIGHWLPPES